MQLLTLMALGNISYRNSRKAIAMTMRVTSMTHPFGSKRNEWPILIDRTKSYPLLQ